ncbi:MAG: hypothetical protein ABIO72_00510 [Patescibacteria group bacterium]
MSLQRVLETARRTGTPVIMTDVSGRDPMVIMPLEQFEALTGEVPSRPAPRPTVSKEERVERVLAELAAQRTEERTNDAALKIESLSVEMPGDDLTLEERFYLEPVEDKGNQA